MVGIYDYVTSPKERLYSVQVSTRKSEKAYEKQTRLMAKTCTEIIKACLMSIIFILDVKSPVIT